MPHAKATVRRNRKRKSVPVLSAAGLSLSLAAGPPTAIEASTTDMPRGPVTLTQQLLHEEEVTDLSLATFRIFEKENAPPRGVRLSGGCGACGGGFYLLPSVLGSPPGGSWSGPGRPTEPYVNRPRRRQFLEEQQAPRNPRVPKNMQVPKNAQVPKQLQVPKNSSQNANRPAEPKPDVATKSSSPTQQTQPVQEIQSVQPGPTSSKAPVQQVQQVQQVQPTEPAFGALANQTAGEQAEPETVSPAISAPN
jgi:hypothetical protein